MQLTRLSVLAAMLAAITSCGKVEPQATTSTETPIDTPSQTAQEVTAPHIGTWEVTLADTEQKARWRFTEQTMSFKERYHHPYQSQAYSYKIDGQNVLVSHPGSTDAKHFVKITMIDENNATLQVKENKTASLKRIIDGPDEVAVMMTSSAKEAPAE